MPNYQMLKNNQILQKNGMIASFLLNPDLAFFRHTPLNRDMVTKHTPQLHTPLLNTSPKMSFKDLLMRVGKDQDRDAFVTLFHHFAPRIKSFMLKQGATDTLAEEIVQNTFVTIWEKAHQYNPDKAAASTWIFTIARNKRIDIMRKEKFIDVNTDHSAIQNASYEMKQSYADMNTIDALNDALETLPPEQEEILRMSFFEEKSHQTIADETHLPLGTVKSRLRLAMKKLKDILETKDKAS